MLGGISS